MTNEPADAPRPQGARDGADEPSFAPPAPPPGPLWPGAEAAAPAAGWPSLDKQEDGPPTPPPAPDDTGTGVPGPSPASAESHTADSHAASGASASGTAFMARYGLVRPLTGRHFAGVCAAVGRATNTDPVLWRVLFAVLTLFGGVGLLAYLIGWLLIPADGDTASPVEAVLGRGVSRTSAPIAVIGTVAALLVFTLVASEGLRPAVVGALVVLGAAVLLSRGTLQRPGQQQAGPVPGAVPPPASVTPTPFQPASTLSMPFAAAAPPAGAPTVPVAQPEPRPVPEPTVQKSPLAEPGVPGGTDPEPAPDADRRDEVAAEHTRPISDALESPTLPQPPAPPQPPAAPYGQPFAPHGPFAPPGPYPPSLGPVGQQTPTRRLPLYGPYPPVPGAGLPWDAAPVSADPMLHYPGMPYSGPPMSTPPKPKVKRPKSRLFRVTLSALAIALGTLAVVHLLGASIAGSAYFAVALTIVGLGLVAGAWVGRSRLLIPLGFALSLGLLISTAASYDGRHGYQGEPEWRTFTAAEEIAANNPYRWDTGDHVLDFTQVDFTGQDVAIEASNDVGRVQVIVPPNVDVEVRAKVEVGDAQVFNNKWGGLSDEWRTVINHGADGPGGGKLTMVISVDVGNLEVYR